MKKQFTILFIAMSLLFVGFGAAAEQDYTPIIYSIDPVVGYGSFYTVESPFQCYPSQIEKNGQIYPGGRIRIGGIQLGQGVQQFVNVYLNGEIVFTPGSFYTYKYFSNSCIDFNLPQSISTGRNCIVFENGKKLKSEEFCFDVSKNTCKASDWKCNTWGVCSVDGTQTRECSLTTDCENPEAVKPSLTQSCIPQCREDKWKCGEWSFCSVGGQQTRICIKDYDCPLIDSQSPTTTQSCSYTPACSADTWQCGNWGTCSPQGIQARSCNKTYDCPSVETAAPATSQYCEAPNQPKQQTPSEDLGISNQNTIIKATVKLVCPVSSTMASQGSGTIINTSGLILTNKHVIDGTAGCLVGFIDDYDDEPYFGDRQIADIYKISSDADVAVLKLRNPSNKILASVNISQSNSSSIKLGEILTTYGYPAKFGTKITYTSGDFSGVDGNYLKTTAVIEHGNSGGGAYLKNGTFIGIPTAVVKGSLNSMGYLLSVNKVNSWLNNSTAYNYNNNNNDYSRVSALLENIDLGALNSLGLFVAGDETNNTTNNNSPEKQKSTTNTDMKLAKRLAGKLLLQVEQGGAIWYVDTKEYKRYSVTFTNALPLFKKLSLGISNSDLFKIPVAKSGQTGNLSMRNRLKGKLLLQVEGSGAIWYVDQNGYRHSVTWDNLLSLFRSLALGITNENLNKIPEGNLN